MQGTLNEIDLRSILRLIELGQRTGELFIEVYPCEGSFSGLLRDGQGKPGEVCYWFLFFFFF